MTAPVKPPNTNADLSEPDLGYDKASEIGSVQGTNEMLFASDVKMRERAK